MTNSLSFNETVNQYIRETRATYSDVTYAFFTGIIYEPHEKIMENLPKVISEIMTIENWNPSGLFRFIKDLSKLTIDCPRLPQYTFQLILKPMFITKFLKLSHIVWQMPDDDTVSLDGHIALFASIINYRMTLKGTGKSLEKTISYVKWKTNNILKKMFLKINKDLDEKDL